MIVNLKTLLQLLTILIVAYALKSFYSTSTADELRWILAPTTFLVELISGEGFTFESHAGYMSSDNSFLIAASCSGVNFLLISFLVLTLRKLWRDRRMTWGFLPVAALIAYSTTLLANTARIVIAMQMHATNFQFAGFDAGELHRIEGIIVYFLFLLLLFICSEKYENARPTKSGLICLLGVYYCVTLGIPIIRGSHGAAEFWQHSAFVLVIPIVLVVPLLLFFSLNRRDPHSI